MISTTDIAPSKMVFCPKILLWRVFYPKQGYYEDDEFEDRML